MCLMPTNTKDPFIYGQNWSRGFQWKSFRHLDQATVMAEIEEHLCSLQNLRSKIIGGPTSIICPPIRVTQNFNRDKKWVSEYCVLS